MFAQWCLQNAFVAWASLCGMALAANKSTTSLMSHSVFDLSSRTLPPPPSSSSSLSSTSAGTMGPGIAAYIMAGIGVSTTPPVVIISSSQPQSTVSTISSISSTTPDISQSNAVSTAFSTGIPGNFSANSGDSLQTSASLVSTNGNLVSNVSRSDTGSKMSSATSQQNFSAGFNPLSPSTVTMYNQTIIGPTYAGINATDCSALLSVYQSASVSWLIAHPITWNQSIESAPAKTYTLNADVVSTSLYVSNGITYGSLSTFSSTSLEIDSGYTMLEADSMITTMPYPFSSPCTMPDIDPSSCSLLQAQLYTGWVPPSSHVPWGPDHLLAPGCTLGCVQCIIRGQNVEVLYWPVTTVPGNSNLTITPNGTGIVTATFGGRVLTSPTVYLSYDVLWATNNCGQVGSSYTDGILAIPLTETLSSFGFRRHHGVQEPTLSFNYADLNEPMPLSIYQKQFDCGVNVTETCPVVIPGNYNPSVHLPQAVRTLDPLWADCAEDWIGVLDPPVALHTVDALTDAPNVSPTPTTKAQPGTTPQMEAPINTGTAEVQDGPSVPQVSNPVVPKQGTAQPGGSATMQPVDPTIDHQDGTIFTVSTDAAGALNVIPISADSLALSPITLSGITITPISSIFVINGQTASRGGSAVVVSGTPISILPSNDGIVIGTSTRAIGAQSTVPINLLSAIVLPGTTVVPVSNMFVIDGQTASAGGPAITVSGTRISVLASNRGIVIGTVTRSIVTPSPTPFVLHPQALNVWVTDGQTLTPGGEITVHGTVISLRVSDSLIVVKDVPTTSSKASGSVKNSSSTSSLLSSPITIGSPTYSPLGGATDTAKIIQSSHQASGNAIRSTFRISLLLLLLNIRVIH